MIRPQWSGHDIRRRIAEPHLAGRGIEIGAGVSPHDLPEGASAVFYDKRGAAELHDLFGQDVDYPLADPADFARDFPGGADFLIAHNVLEHIHDHIAAVRGWHSLVKPGGIVVLSVPAVTGRDAARPPATFSHVLFDHLLQRDEAWLETREHVMSFCLGWHDSWADKDRAALSAHILSEAKRTGHDCHWHALPRADWDKVIAAAASLDGLGLSLIASTDAEAQGDLRTEEEIIYIYRVLRDRPGTEGFASPAADMETVRRLLQRGLDGLAPRSASPLSRLRSALFRS